MSIEKTTRELIINQTLQSLLPPLEQDVYEGLEASILKHGCLSPLVVWGDTIVDGHWRYIINIQDREFVSRYQRPTGAGEHIQRELVLLGGPAAL